jgi:uncharacterized phage protein gp47/JayE
MPLQPPELDDRDFESLFAEARSLIPRYAPEWTNHNEADPGITMLQLFAWFTDLLLYRVNQVPERSYVKFLQLLGVQTRPAAPAHVELTFTTARPDLDVTVPAATQVATAGSGDKPPVVFEVDEAFVAIGPRLSAVQVYDGFSYRDVTTANAAGGQGIEPFGPHAHLGGALLLGFETPGQFTSQPITIGTHLRQPRHAPVVKADADLEAVPPPARFGYHFWDGTSWEPLLLQVDETRAFTRSGRIVVFGPGARSVKSAVGVVPAKLHWIRVHLTEVSYERAPSLSAVVVNPAPATAAITLRDEVLGGSDGMPNQGPFQLSTTPVIAGSLVLEIDEGSGFQPWEQVDDFFASTPDDTHFMLDRTTGQIRFGDGRRGRIPVANPARPVTNIVARRYRAGGGRGGNVGAGTVTTLQTAAPGIAAVTNRDPASGGTDEETVDQAKLRAPALLKARNRAVTAEDFEVLTLAAPANVARAKALALRHPRFPDIDVPGAVTVVVVPDAPGPAPRPNESTLRMVCAWLDRHRLVTTEVFATAATYRQVKVSGDVVARRDADLAAVRRAVGERLMEWLHPLTGGDGTGWQFGGTLYASSLFRVVLDVPGVDRIRDNQLTVELDGEAQPFCRDVEIGRGELIEPLEPDLRLTYG